MIWTILTVVTLIEILRAATEYAYYGHGLGYGLTVIIPLLVLLPLMIGYQIEQMIYLHRGERQQTWMFYGHIFLLCVFLIAFIWLILLIK